MFYDRELNFLKEVFLKSHLRVEIITTKEVESTLSDYKIGGLIDSRFLPGGSVSELLHTAEQRTVYKVTDIFHRCFIFLSLPQREERSLLCIGPYLSSDISENMLLNLSWEMKISVQKQKYLKEYYESLPILQQDGHLMLMFTTFCELLWKMPSFAIVEIEREGTSSDAITKMENEDNTSNELLVNLEAIELRYSYENELLRAVTLGKLHMDDRVGNIFSPELFEKRANNPLRNAKNYGIIMNTLLRKAAEEGGVHPFYLDKVSSEFAYKIEGLTSLDENATLMREMFRRYCRLVRNNSTKNYSNNVRRAIVLIDADLSVDLSAGKIAKELDLSVPYLSTLFKREVGKTITEFVLDRRMSMAAQLLKTTELQIQTIALYTGIVDVQYFSKLFKKTFSISPSEYRRKNK